MAVDSAPAPREGKECRWGAGRKPARQGTAIGRLRLASPRRQWTGTRRYCGFLLLVLELRAPEEEGSERNWICTVQAAGQTRVGVLAHKGGESNPSPRESQQEGNSKQEYFGPKMNPKPANNLGLCKFRPRTVWAWTGVGSPTNLFQERKGPVHYFVSANLLPSYRSKISLKKKAIGPK